VTAGLKERFGMGRVFNTPISEQAIAGAAVGAALVGARPIVEIQVMDFLSLALDQIANHAAKLPYMTGGQLRVPLVVRGPVTSGIGLAAQHSQSLEAWVAHIPGLKVVMPSTPADAKGLLKSAIRDNNPVVIFEDKMMYTLKGLVPGGDHLVPIGLADVKREGEDVTVIATSSMVQVALSAADELERDGVSLEVVDPRTIAPLDRATLVASARKTGRVVIVDEGHQSYGASAELAAVIAEDAFWYLDAPVVRLGAIDVPIPVSPVLEDETVPTPERVADAALRLLGKGR